MYVRLQVYIDFKKVFYLSLSTNIENHVPEIFVLQMMMIAFIITLGEIM